MTKLSAQIWGVSVDFTQDIRELIDTINAYRNKDKNEICRTLEGIDCFIARWYKFELDLFAKVLGLVGETLDEKHEIFQIIFKSSRIPECEATREYCDDYLKDTKVRDIIDRRDSTDDVDKLREKMESFSITAYDEKRKWIDTSTESKKWTVTGKDIGIWLDKLQKIRVEVRILTSKIRRNLECPTSSGRFSIEVCKE